METLMKREMQEFLEKNGYRQVQGSTTGMSLCFQVNPNAVEVVSIIEQLPNFRLGKTDYDVIKKKVKALFLSKGFENVHIMTLILTDNPEDYKDVSQDDAYCWIIDKTLRRIISYENQVNDFYGLRSRIENFLTFESRNSYQARKVFSQRQAGKTSKSFASYINVTSVLVALNVLIFLLCTYQGDLLYNIGVLHIDSLLVDQEYYRLLTAVFLHASSDHIFGNMMILFMSGQYVEKIIGHTRFLFLYILAGIAGNLVSLYMQGVLGEYYTSLGASGAVFGVMGALLVFAIMRHKEVRMMAPQRVLFYLVYSLYIGFRATNIDNFAHIGGLFAGSVLAILFWLSIKNKKGIK